MGGPPRDAVGVGAVRYDNGWLEEARGVELVEVLAALGVTRWGRRSFGPCPACGEGRRSRHDRRPPCGLHHSAQGWHCHACQAHGDGLDAVALQLFEGKRVKELQARCFGELRAWYSARGWCAAEEGAPQNVVALRPPRAPPPVLESPEYPEPSELRALLRRARPLAEAPDGPASRFLEERGFSRSAPAGLLLRVEGDEEPWPEWWPWGAGWPLVVSAVDARGIVRSVHARAVVRQPGRPKTRWPLDRLATGLLFAEPVVARPMLRRSDCTSPGVRTVLVCEGLTDYLWACQATAGRPEMAVLGGTSGSWAALGDVRWPDGARVFAFMDPDEAGARYLAQIRRAVPLRVDAVDLSQLLSPRARALRVEEKDEEMRA